MLAEKFIRANEEEEEIVSDLTSLERDKNVSELKSLKQNLEQKYSKLEKSLNEKFKSLSELLEERRCFLMNELNNYHKECQSLIDSYLINFNEQENNNETINEIVFTITNAINLLDKWTDEENNLINDDKKLISFFENLNSLVKNSSKKLIVETKSKDNLCVNKSDDCSIHGSGLSECFTNEEASFVLEFKNRAASYLSKSSVSFLGKWKLIMKRFSFWL